MKHLFSILITAFILLALPVGVLADGIIILPPHLQPLPTRNPAPCLIRALLFHPCNNWLIHPRSLARLFR